MKVIKSAPFHMQAYKLIKEEILSYRMLGGEKVNENLLAQRLNISRSPIREALRMLERDRLLVYNASGLVVNPLPLEEVREIYECRIMLESFAARLTAERIDDDNLRRLCRYIECTEEAHRLRDTAMVVESNTGFHDTIISLCGNSHLIGLSEITRSLAILSRSKELHGYKRSPDYLGEHKKILEALTRRDADLAEQAVRRHIANDLAFFSKSVLG